VAIKDIKVKNIILGFAFVALLGTSVSAQVKMDGQFVASQNCDAVQSIKKSSNPGNVKVQQGKSYPLLGKNKSSATHYWIEVAGANPQQRWVTLDCGTINGVQSEIVAPKSVAIDTPSGTIKPKPKPKGPKGGIPTYAFAISWEPAFCVLMASKSECKNQTTLSYDASHFSLHGLWPQPRRNVFCGVDQATAALDDQHKWEQLPMPDMMLETKRELNNVMPGTASLLERHEWIKHGTCYAGGSADTYFRDAIRLTNDVNGSAVQKFMQMNIGRNIKAEDIRAKFDEVYGKGAGERVGVACSKDGLISELTISLKGDIPSGVSLSSLILAAEPVRLGCEAGLVAAVK
jgi:ribonuclease T2